MSRNGTGRREEKYYQASDLPPHSPIQAFPSRWKCLEVRFTFISTSAMRRKTASCMPGAWLSRDPATLRTHAKVALATYASRWERCDMSILGWRDIEYIRIIPFPPHPKGGLGGEIPVETRRGPYHDELTQAQVISCAGISKSFEIDAYL